MRGFKTSKTTNHEWWDGHHRFEHWYRDNQVYFITARVRGRARVFASEQAKQIFWTHLEKLCKEFGLVLWVASLLDNHYHLLATSTKAKTSPSSCNASTAPSRNL